MSSLALFVVRDIGRALRREARSALAHPVNQFSSAAAYLGSCLPTHVPKALSVTDPLLIDLSHYNALSKRLNRVFHTNHKGFLTKQEARNTALSALQQAVIQAIFENTTQLEDFKTLVFSALAEHVQATGQGVDSERLVLQYIEKFSGRAFDWIENHGNRVLSCVQKSIAECKYAYTRTTRNADWNALKRIPAVRQEILNQRAMRELRVWCGQVSDVLMQHELDSTYWFKTTEQTELCIRGAYLRKKGPDWLAGELRNRAVNLERRMSNQIEQCVQGLCERPQVLDKLRNNQHGLFQRVEFYFASVKTDEPWVHCADFVKKLLLTKCKEALSTGTWSKVNQLKTEVDTQVEAWRKELGDLGIEHVSDMALLEKASRLKAHMQQNNWFARQHTTLSDYLVGQAINAFKVMANPTVKPSSLDKAALAGTYFKKTKSALQPYTRIQTPSGKVYELLNTLASQESVSLFIQHRLDKKGKVVLGAGAFGKVRLARNAATQHIVAVKKYSQNANSGALRELTKELNNFQTLKDRANALFVASDELQSLASMLDFAHVKNKSYMFIPLANGGDGNDVVDQLYEQRASGEQAQAEQRFLNIAQGYAKAVMVLHKLGLHHRDIKPANFVHMLKAGHAEQTKLSDFGTVQPTQKAKQIKSDGTHTYCPPEKFPSVAGDVAYDAEKHDVFSLGVSLLELKVGARVGRLGFSNSRHVLNLKRDDGSIHPCKVSLARVPGSLNYRLNGIPTDTLRQLDMRHLDNIMAKLIAKDPTQRLTAAQAFEYLARIQLN